MYSMSTKFLRDTFDKVFTSCVQNCIFVVQNLGQIYLFTGGDIEGHIGGYIYTTWTGEYSGYGS